MIYVFRKQRTGHARERSPGLLPAVGYQVGYAYADLIKAL